MMLVLYAAAGGAVGAASRYLVGIGAAKLLGYEFPWGTLIVNVVGCFLMGLLIELGALKFSMSSEMRTFLATGVLGGFTTFSAFALDFAFLYERKEHLASWAYLGASVILSVLALFAALALVRSWVQ